MQIRRSLLSKPYLPSGYTRLNYITGNGAYIDTGIKLQQGCIVKIVAEIVTNNTEQCPWGYRWDGTWSNITECAIYHNSGNRAIAVGKGLSKSQHGTNEAYSFDIKNTFVIDSVNQIVTVNGTIPTSLNYDFSNGAMFNTDGSSQYNPYLFAMNSKGNASVIEKNMKLYEYKVIQSGTVLQHLIPVKNPSNVYGMFDLASRQFIESANSSTFTGA